jgi:putative ubiquitin-RnfH superfamily antitoxin RatB of RatAB toxin-antitoxin module
MADRMITVEVVHLDEDRQWLRRVEVVEGSTVIQAINQSRIAETIPAGRFDPERLGIFSKRVTADHIVQAGDRIEIYRPLILDPMEARRRRAR